MEPGSTKSRECSDESEACSKYFPHLLFISFLPNQIILACKTSQNIGPSRISSAINMIQFRPNCTIPLGLPAFVAPPNVRSTMDIVWGCMTTILLCCWSIQHLNLPPQFRPTTTRQKFMRQLYFLWRKAKWMIITLFFPEGILAKAVVDLRSCRLHSHILRAPEGFVVQDGVPWSKTHTSLADMGGFALRFNHTSQPIQSPCPSGPSVDTSGERRQSLQGSLVKMTEASQRSIENLDETLDRVQGCAAGHSLPNRSSPRNPDTHGMRFSQNVYDDTQAHYNNQASPNEPAPSSRNIFTQHDRENRPSPDLELLSLLSTTKQSNRKDAFSALPAQQQLQQPTTGEVVMKTSNKKKIRTEDRQKFRKDVMDASRLYGSVVWNAFERNEAHGAQFRFREDVWGSMPFISHYSSAILALEGDVWVLTAAQLIEARRIGLLSRLPNLTEDEISDRNKGSLFVKLLALLQVSWMVIQLIARAKFGLTSTPVEIMTLSFAACAFITYLLLLNRPQDVDTSIYIDAARPPTRHDVRAILGYTPECFWLRSNRLPCVPNNAIHLVWPISSSERVRAFMWLLSSMAAGSAMFGGIHLLAWNFAFPTVFERTLWRTSSLITLIGPSVMAVAENSAFWYHHRFSQSSATAGVDPRLAAFHALSMLVLVLARLFIMTEALRSLYYLPSDAYLTTWATYIPHIV